MLVYKISTYSVQYIGKGFQNNRKKKENEKIKFIIFRYVTCRLHK